MDTPKSGRGGGQAWTMEAQVHLLLLIIAQFRTNNQPINWGEINMPGRTTKSLQNTWFKLNKMSAELVSQGGASATPSKKTQKNATPRSGSGKKAQPVVTDDEADDDFPSTKKRLFKDEDAVTNKRIKSVKFEDEKLPKFKKENGTLIDDILWES